MTLQELEPTSAEVQSLRAELDELLRARQFAAQRERRLTEALRSAGAPAGDRRQHGDLQRQLAQAQHLREGLGARCLELSDRLIAMEDSLLVQQRYSGSGRSAAEADHRPPTSTTPPTPPQPSATLPPKLSEAAPAAELSGHPHRGIPAAKATTAPTRPPAAPSRPTATAASAGPAAPSTGINRPRNAAPSSAPPLAPPITPDSADAHQQRPQPARHRTVVELGALAKRITDLHLQGAVRDSAAIVAQAAVSLVPADVARLVGLLRDGGPTGAAGYLARATSYGPPEQTARTLAELRTTGLVEEAAELFHTLWSVPVSALPAMLAALEQAGQSADGHTLLWEWASAPPAELAELAARLREAGRADDVSNLLRQAVGRPMGDAAAVALALDPALAVGLVGEVVRLRSAGDLGEFAAAVHGQPVLYEALLGAVSGLDESRARSAFASLRSAGLPTEPPRTRGRGRIRR
ncbi:hypothetical protein ACGFX4_17470 [Kitasatospora sp. NPDC048365]|uniref:hypothetical protein n=1 Tax=Kitasatospora sp. NPDC048365 TaxID=3364050 RepID=UPI0037194A9B